MTFYLKLITLVVTLGIFWIDLIPGVGFVSELYFPRAHALMSGGWFSEEWGSKPRGGGGSSPIVVGAVFHGDNDDDMTP